MKEDAFDPKRISSYSSIIQKFEERQDRKINNISSRIDSVAKKQDELVKKSKGGKLEINEIGYTKGIQKVEKSMDKILKKMGYIIEDVSKNAKKIMVETAVTTKDTIKEYGQIINKELDINKQNLLALSLSKSTPIFGYFASKFFETSVWQNFMEKIKSYNLDFLGKKIKSGWSSLKYNISERNRRRNNAKEDPIKIKMNKAKEIPKMAKGGIVEKGGLVRLHPAEIVTPIDKLASILKQAFDPLREQEVKTSNKILKELRGLRYALVGVTKDIGVSIMQGIVRNPIMQSLIATTQLLKKGFSAVGWLFGKQGKYGAMLPRGSNVFENITSTLGLIFTRGMTKLDIIINYLGRLVKKITGSDVSDIKEVRKSRWDKAKERYNEYKEKYEIKDYSDIFKATKAEVKEHDKDGLFNYVKNGLLNEYDRMKNDPVEYAKSSLKNEASFIIEPGKSLYNKVKGRRIRKKGKTIEENVDTISGKAKETFSKENIDRLSDKVLDSLTKENFNSFKDKILYTTIGEAMDSVHEKIKKTSIIDKAKEKGSYLQEKGTKLKEKGLELKEKFQNKVIPSILNIEKDTGENLKGTNRIVHLAKYGFARILKFGHTVLKRTGLLWLLSKGSNLFKSIFFKSRNLFKGIFSKGKKWGSKLFGPLFKKFRNINMAGVFKFFFKTLPLMIPKIILGAIAIAYIIKTALSGGNNAKSIFGKDKPGTYLTWGERTSGIIGGLLGNDLIGGILGLNLDENKLTAGLHKYFFKVVEKIVDTSNLIKITMVDLYSTAFMKVVNMWVSVWEKISGFAVKAKNYLSEKTNYIQELLDKYNPELNENSDSLYSKIKKGYGKYKENVEPLINANRPIPALTKDQIVKIEVSAEERAAKHLDEYMGGLWDNNNKNAAMNQKTLEAALASSNNTISTVTNNIINNLTNQDNAIGRFSSGIKEIWINPVQ